MFGLDEVDPVEQCIFSGQGWPVNGPSGAFCRVDCSQDGLEAERAAGRRLHVDRG